MSFLLDPPLLIVAGAAIEYLDPDDARPLDTATLCTFVGVSAALYARLPLPGLGLFWKPFGSTDGRDFMINSGVLRIDHRRVGWRGHITAIALWATYPLWLRLGHRLCRPAARSKQ